VGTRRTSPSIACTTLSDNFTSTNTVGGIALANRLFGGTDQPGTVIIVHQLLTLGADDYVILAFNKVGQNATTERTIHLAAANLTDQRSTGCASATTRTPTRCRCRTSGLDTSKHILHLVSDGTTVELYGAMGVCVTTWSRGLGRRPLHVRPCAALVFGHQRALQTNALGARPVLHGRLQQLSKSPTLTTG
jgi:hypothetical protein